MLRVLSISERMMGELVVEQVSGSPLRSAIKRGKCISVCAYVKERFLESREEDYPAIYRISKLEHDFLCSKSNYCSITRATDGVWA